MVERLDTTAIALLIAGAVAGHLLLMVSARWVNPVVTLMAAFLLLAPVSAMLIPGAEVFKYLRLYVNVLATLLGMVFLLFRRYRISGVGWAFFLFILFYVLAGLWSNRPIAAVKFKGLLLPAVAAGLLAGAMVRSTQELRVALRVFLIASVCFAIPSFVNVMLLSPALAHGVEITFAGLNPNRLGQESTAMLILCTAVALYDPAKKWKIVAYGTATMLAAVVLATGSRASVGEGIIAVAILAMPMLKRPALLTTLGGITSLILWMLMSAATGQLYARYTQLDLENRADVWQYALSEFHHSRMIGQGWVWDEVGRREGTSTNLHSIYFQVLAETGLLGAFLFACLFGFIAISSVRLFFQTRRAGADRRWTFCAVAFIVGPLAHGIAESSSIQGSSINIMITSFGLGLFAPLADLTRAKREASLSAKIGAFRGESGVLARHHGGDDGLSTSGHS